MTIKEIAEMLGVSEYTVNHHWKDLRGRAARKGWILVKVGKGTTAAYGIIKDGAIKADFEYKGVK